MKAIFIIFGALFLCGQMFSQKSPTVMTSNLNSSRSNIYRIFYDPTIIKPENVDSILVALEKLGPVDTATLKKRLTTDFKRFGIDSIKVKKILFFTALQYTDCSMCNTQCKGRCVQETGTGCVCISNSESNLRNARTVNPSRYTCILLSDDHTDTTAGINAIANSISKVQGGVIKQ